MTSEPAGNTVGSREGQGGAAAQRADPRGEVLVVVARGVQRRQSSITVPMALRIRRGGVADLFQPLLKVVAFGRFLSRAREASVSSLPIKPRYGSSTAKAGNQQTLVDVTNLLDVQALV